MDKFLELLVFSSDRKKMLQVLDVLLWLSLIFVTFDRWILSTTFVPIAEIDQIIDYFAHGAYIVYLQWSIITLLGYFTLKFLLIRIIPISQRIFKIYMDVVLDERIRISLLDIIYKGIRARRSYKKLARSHKDRIQFERNVQLLEISKIIMGVLLKSAIIGVVCLDMVNGKIYWLPILGISVSLILIFVIEVAIIVGQSQNRIFDLIEEIGN